MCTLRFKIIISYTIYVHFSGFCFVASPFFFTTIKTAGAIFCFGLVDGNHVFYDHHPVCDGLVKKERKNPYQLCRWMDEPRIRIPPIWMMRRPFTTTQSRPSPAHRPSGNDAIPNSSRSDWSEKKISQIYFERWLWRSRAKLVGVDLQERVTVFRSNLTEKKKKTPKRASKLNRKLATILFRGNPLDCKVQHWEKERELWLFLSSRSQSMCPIAKLC